MLWIKGLGSKDSGCGIHGIDLTLVSMGCSWMGVWMRQLLLALILGLVTITNVWSSERELVVAFSEAEPWKINDPNHKYTGIDMEILQRLADANGLQLLVKAAPLARCQAMTKSGDPDIITTVLRTREREHFIRYLEAPYQTHSTKVFYLRSEDPRQVVSYEQLYGLDIGVKRGARYGARFDEDGKLHKQAVASHVLNFKKLAAGRLDLVISTESEGDYLIKDYGWQGQFKKAALRFDLPTNVYFGLSKHSSLLTLAPTLESQLQQLIRDGEVERIIGRYQ